ncbi:MAG TPA: ABC-F family ATP-binding cassette domain-containing protein [Bryobacteraceae bacterium]|nr:ABC-F family ATP-binding cassette domain-containing protein [Bryobacteraceae bacterium]
MAVVLSCSAVSKRFGVKPLFENLTMALHDGQRIGLTGPNGSGKSTLMRILSGLEPPDEGNRAIRKQAIVAYVPQDSVFTPGQTVRSILDDALADLPLTEEEKRLRIEMEASRAGFRDFDAEAASLSGGWRKRLAIVCALVRYPQAVLLDEPTNHLDIDGILWLERLLIQADFASLFISHDRYFLERVATHTAEINTAYPDGIYQAEGNYSKFLERRAEFLLAQQKLQDALGTKVRREIEWLRRGPKARTTKSKARIDEAHRLIGELDDVSSRNRTSTASIALNASDRKTKRLIQVEGLAAAPGGKTLFENLNFTLQAGTKLGLVGGNGSGKSTLLRILEGHMEPQAGVVQRADLLRVVTLDQNRRLADENATLKQALCPDGDSVIYNGQPVHVAGWAARFLFTKEQLIQPVRQLSGGERARVLLANLMLRPADVLFLDEPTNDLDIPTLEVLEDNLLDFPGALVLVTHDRYLLDRVASTVIALEGDGRWGLYAEYSQWEEERAARRAPAVSKKEPVEAAPSSSAPKKKLSYLEQREWDGMEVQIMEAEEALAEAKAQMDDPAVFTDHVKVQETTLRMEAAQHRVEALYARWAELEAKVG